MLKYILSFGSLNSYNHLRDIKRNIAEAKTMNAVIWHAVKTQRRTPTPIIWTEQWRIHSNARRTFVADI